MGSIAEITTSAAPRFNTKVENVSVELFKDDTYGVTRGIQCDTVFKDDTYGVTRDTYGVTHTV